MNGTWKGALRTVHIHFLELTAVFLTVLHFQSVLRGKRVLVHTDNRVTFFITIIREAQDHRVHFRWLATACLGQTNLLSFQTVYLPGRLNQATYALSRGSHRETGLYTRKSCR